MTDIKYKEEVRAGIKEGVDKLANAVKVTMGPRGLNVIIHRNNGQDPQVTKDGVTVAKEIELEDPLENIGATVVKRVAEKSNDSAGDGTTTATVLAQAILSEGLKLVAAGHNPVEIKRGIDKATYAIVEQLNKIAIPVKHGDKMIEQIATVSANNDPEIGKIVADAFNMVGQDGAVSVEEGAGFETVVNRVDGLQFDRGMASTFFSTSPEKAEVLMRNPMILVVDGKLTTTNQIMAVLGPVIKMGRPLLVIAEDITGDALSTLILNKLKGGHQLAAVKAPAFGKLRKDLTEDIATIIGAKVVPSDIVSEITTDYFDQLLGSATTVKIEAMSTVIMGGKRSEKEVLDRIADIDREIAENRVTKFEIDKLKERKAKLGGGVAIIEVGAKSEIEMKEKKDRVDDAKEAVISALEEGVVIGGGSALLMCKHLKIKTIENTDEKIGVQIMMKAIEAPFKIICENASVNGELKMRMVKEQFAINGRNGGYDAKNDKVVNMLDAGILDPKKVTRIAIESAASVSGTLLTTACALIQK
jgi:chaperonin GroEL